MSSPRSQRCAIYTRVSSDQGLEQDFNSLDAQREACQAYVKSQSAEGWRCQHEPYDDGGFSGGSLERPALQRLLQDVRENKIDIIVVYKVDRLTRSLTDFAKLIEILDGKGVSFVSVTQSFNTTSSMGRLTLNVLLSFAQFEREVTGERIRDKIAAAKKKGLWMGGIVPFGYRVESRRLVIEPAEAEIVRYISKRYLELGSIATLLNDLAHRGIRTRIRTLASGRRVGGILFTTGPLQHLLRNRVYLGEINHRGKSYPGDHEPILGNDTFDAVQTRLAEQRNGRMRGYAQSEALLARRIFDDRGNRMTPTYSVKGSARYRYYQSWLIPQGRKNEAGSVHRVPAQDLERAVAKALRDWCADKYGSGEVAVRDDRSLIQAHLIRVMVKQTSLELVVDCSPRADQSPTATSQPPDYPQEAFAIPWSVPSPVRRREVISPPGAVEPCRPIRSEARARMIAAIARGRRWLNELVDGSAPDTMDIAQREGISERSVRSTISLAFLAPSIVTAAIDGRLPRGFGVSQLTDLPMDWSQQRRTLALA